MENENRSNLEIANEVQKKTIERIARWNIGASQRAELVLIVLGVKPATDISLYEWNDQPDTIETEMQNANLSFVKILKESKNVVAEYAVARDFTTAHALANLSATSDHVRFGELMGYPKSAVDAFIQSSKLDRDSYPDMKGIIFSMMLSQKHWQEEVGLLRYWSELVKKYAPSVYDELNGQETITTNQL